MKKSFLALSALMLLASANSFATTYSTPGHECRDEIATPGLTCINPVGGADVRLYIIEFQTCKDGNISELDRSILGMNVVSQKRVDDIHTIDADNISIQYAEKRILIDAKNRVDDLSFLMPKTATIVDGDQTIEMSVSDKTEPDYEGSLDSHYVGAFKLSKANGKVVKGKLICSVNR
ncbi:MAG: hypothetical protein H7177_17275 [Rhizobacter sp.]|nr:hypothetical protein [Bacteriovorax sp.]